MRRSDPGLHVRAWAHAGEVAQWAVILLGWLWLGEQGMRLGWSWASGVGAVALWWAARLLCRGSTWALQAGRGVLGVWGLLTACGVFSPLFLPTFSPNFLSTFLPSQAAAHSAHAGLLALALLWGVWSGLIETRSQVSTFQLGTLAWHPVLAAALVALAWRMPGGEWAAACGASSLLAACAALLHARDRATPRAALRCRGMASGQHVLVPSVMGLMMGSLWLGNAWCVGLGLSTDALALAHLVLMAGLPSVVAWFLRNTGPWRPAGQATGHASLWLVAAGALMLLGDSAALGVLAMALPSLAWALHCSRARGSEPVTGVTGVTAVKSLHQRRGMALLALLLGPALLVAVGVASPELGPWAVKSGMALLGVLAAVQALCMGWRTPGRGAGTMAKAQGRAFFLSRS